MSDKAEDLAKELLEKTKGGKLGWRVVPTTQTGSYWTESENYRADLEDGFSFSIGRTAKGDDKMLDFELARSGRTVLAAHADNLPLSPESRGIVERGRAILEQFQEIPPVEAVDSSRIARFRLFSDLFYAARKSGLGGDQTIERVQQILARLGENDLTA